MGAAVSTGVDNDHLIDNLIEANYIKTPIVEKVFRAVDRAFYFLPEFRKSAYRDLAWKHGNLHLSAPCIYSTVLEELNLKPGQSFLNIGSGTGYLSTMVGLILGPYGVNHGIEIHQDVVDYAYSKLEQFKTQCSAVDIFEFCEPHFIVGNVRHLQSDQKYDRIYCGAACPSYFHDNIKQYLKVGGILIVPWDDDLLKFERKTEHTWESQTVLEVSFSYLHLPGKNITSKMVEFEETYPPCLQSLCRSSIRTVIRDVCENEDPDLTCPRETRRKRCNTERNLIIPIFETNAGTWTSAVGFRSSIRNLTRDNENENLDRENGSVREIDDNDDDQSSTTQNGEIATGADDDEMHDETVSSTSNQSDVEEEADTKIDSSSGRRAQNNGSFVCHRDRVIRLLRDRINRSPHHDTIEATSTTTSSNATSSVVVTERLSKSCSVTNEDVSSPKKPCPELAVERAEAKSSPTRSATEVEEDDEDDDLCGSVPKKMAKREKLDSGISEESDDGKVSASNASSYSESTFSETMDVESDDSDFSDNSCNETRLLTDLDSSCSKFDTDESKTTVKYRMALEKKIHALPLPNPIKIYLNYGREFKFTC